MGTVRCSLLDLFIGFYLNIARNLITVPVALLLRLLW